MFFFRFQKHQSIYFTVYARCQFFCCLFFLLFVISLRKKVIKITSFHQTWNKKGHPTNNNNTRRCFHYRKRSIIVRKIDLLAQQYVFMFSIENDTRKWFRIWECCCCVLYSNKKKEVTQCLCLKVLPVYLAIHGMKIVTCFFHFRLIAVFLEPRSQSFN